MRPCAKMKPLTSRLSAEQRSARRLWMPSEASCVGNKKNSVKKATVSVVCFFARESALGANRSYLSSAAALDEASPSTEFASCFFVLATVRILIRQRARRVLNYRIVFIRLKLKEGNRRFQSCSCVAEMTHMGRVPRRSRSASFFFPQIDQLAAR